MSIILDTNVWSELGRRNTRRQIEGLATKNNWIIQTPPATLLEVMRTTDPIARSKIVEVMSSKHWRRLRSEADLEAAEIVAEAKRLRPSWVRQVPLPGSAETHRTLWTKKVWRDARENPESFIEASAKAHDAADRHVAEVAKQNRRFVHEQAPTLADIDRSIEVGHDARYIGESRVPEPSRRVEAWRYRARDVFWHSLRSYTFKRMSGGGDTYADWIEPYLWIDRVAEDFDDFSTFWFDEIEAVRVPRTWLRGAVELAQLLGKVTASVGRDEQLTSYLPDCDSFVSNDRRFLAALEVVKKSCPFEMPRLIAYPNLEADDAAVARLEEVVTEEGIE